MENRLSLAFSQHAFHVPEGCCLVSWSLLWAFQLPQHTVFSRLLKICLSFKKCFLPLSNCSGLPGSAESFERCFSSILAVAPSSSAVLHLSGPLLFHGWFLKCHLHVTTIPRLHNLDSSGRMTASLVLYKCFITLLTNTQLEGSATWLYLNP